MNHIYCISGFGADERTFSRLDFNGNYLHFIPWQIPEEDERMESYALRMSKSIDHENPVLLGLSFGGMMCIEIAKIIDPIKVIIISSIKTYHELPGWMRLSGALKLDKIFPMRTFRIIEPLENHTLGIETKEELQLVRTYRRNVSQQYTNWAIHQIINWKNEWKPKTLFHIHGGKDHIFPIRNITADFVIAAGGHFMIMNRSNKVNSLLKKILEAEND